MSRIALSGEERELLARIAEGSLHVDCLTRPRAVAALLDFGLIECDGEHFVATPGALPYLRARTRAGG
jgi:hypothetical protein